MQERIAVIGLGYVGLPVALAFARKFPGAIGFDVNKEKVEELRRGFDRNQEVSEERAQGVDAQDHERRRRSQGRDVLRRRGADAGRRQQRPRSHAGREGVARPSARRSSKGAVVVYESTVYPGVTEDICGPILAKVSGLVQGKDFKLGYSPERINPGDKEHTLERIMKVVSGEDAETLERVAAAYGAIIDAGVHRAPSIKVAEAAKVIENTQRDLNIALMNELAIIFDRMGIRTARRARGRGHEVELPQVPPGPRRRPLHRRRPVLPHDEGAAARLPARGHPRGPPHQRQRRAVRRAAPGEDARSTQDIPVKGARVGVLGLTFKEDVQRPAQQQGAGHHEASCASSASTPLIHDPPRNPAEAHARVRRHADPRSRST